MKPAGIYIVFDGPPGPESGRFVEVEDENERGLGPAMTGAAWRQRDDGWWELGPFDVASLRSRLERAEGENKAMREAITKAANTMSASQYVGGPTEREAWRAVSDALAPFVLHEQGMNPAASTGEDDDGR